MEGTDLLGPVQGAEAFRLDSCCHGCKCHVTDGVLVVMELSEQNTQNLRLNRSANKLIMLLLSIELHCLLTFSWENFSRSSQRSASKNKKGAWGLFEPVDGLTFY